MPLFIGSRLDSGFSPTFKEVYEFTIEPPAAEADTVDASEEDAPEDAEFDDTSSDEDEFDANAELPAIVPIEMSDDDPENFDHLHSFVAENLARLYGAQENGDEIEIVLRQKSHSGIISRFRLTIVANFASRNRGPQYVQLGTMDLADYFEFKRESQRRFLELVLDKDGLYQCEDEYPKSEFAET